MPKWFAGPAVVSAAEADYAVFVFTTDRRVAEHPVSPNGAPLNVYAPDTRHIVVNHARTLCIDDIEDGYGEWTFYTLCAVGVWMWVGDAVDGPQAHDDGAGAVDPDGRADPGG